MSQEGSLMLDLAISVINYKTKTLTESCLSSILDKKWQISYEIFLVDNASGDGSVEYLKKKFPQVSIIESKKNLGFAGGHNLVLANNTARYILILNSDTEILDKILDQMVKFMDSNPKVGISSCKVLGFDNKLQPNAGDLPLGLSLFTWLFNLKALGIMQPSFHRSDSKFYEASHEVGWVSGNFMMIRKEVLDEIGLLNDNYFMYFEDVDYCFRAKKVGYKVMINPSVNIKHLSGGSLDNPRLRQWTGEFRGLLIFYQSQFGFLAAYLIRMLIYLSVGLRFIAFTAVGKLNYAKTYAEIFTKI